MTPDRRAVRGGSRFDHAGPVDRRRPLHPRLLTQLGFRGPAAPSVAIRTIHRFATSDALRRFQSPGALDRPTLRRFDHHGQFVARVRRARSFARRTVPAHPTAIARKQRARRPGPVVGN
jgi:hypothetical protein